MSAGRENRIHIGIYGRCNAGKSSLLNYITDSDIAVVSPEGGTTTDPVRKNYEITGLGPVVWIDTAGLDDRSPLGELRLQKTIETLSQIDLALIVCREWSNTEEKFAARLKESGLPYVVIPNDNGFASREEIFQKIKEVVPPDCFLAPSMLHGKVRRGDIVLLVCPIDSQAPAGRLILPQVQAIRELLDNMAIAVVVQPSEVRQVFAAGLTPSLVVTDSQVFAEVEKIIPQGTELTSFSILLAAAKGDMELYAKGLQKADSLRDGDRILIVENCLHHPTCEDIGRVKIPRWLDAYSGKQLEYTFVSGLAALPHDLHSYTLMVQCGGCMVTRSQLRNRIRQVAAAGVAVTNYGMLIRKITTARK